MKNKSLIMIQVILKPMGIYTTGKQQKSHVPKAGICQKMLNGQL